VTAATNYTENLVLTWLLTGSAATRPTAWFVALHSADPGETGATSELSGNGYARVSATFTVSGTAPTTATNSGDVTFAAATGSNWAAATHASVWDASSAGNCLGKGALSSSVTINVGDNLKIPASNLNITLD